MKKSKVKVYTVICVACLLILSLLTFSGCYSIEMSGVVDAQINENGELVLIYQDGTEQNLGVVVGQDGSDGATGADGKDGADGESGNDGQDGSLVITSDGSSIPAASSKGLRSAVSIVCNFTKTVQSSGFRPGSSSTTTSEYSSAGSGVIYQLDSAEGDAFIITNYHVVYDASSNSENGISEDITVYLFGSEVEEKAIEATYVGGSLYYDIAVLHVDDSEILANSCATEIDIADSDNIVVGDTAIAIGNAQGYGISASLGVVSVDSEYITMTAADESTTVSFRVMRIDTAVNSGNSGGGLFNDEGDLIGIVNAKIVDDGVENIGYAIPSNVAISVADNIIDYCFNTDLETVQRAMLGVTVSASDSKAVYDLETGMIGIEETISVYEVTDGALADEILKEGDVFVSVTLNGETKEITRQYHIIDLMLDVRAGDSLELIVLRNGETVSLTISITEACIVSY